MEIQALRDKLSKIHPGSATMCPLFKRWNVSFFCYEPFSKKTTQTTLDDIVIKLRAHYKKDTHKRYLQKYFPYYVFPSIVMDLEGNIVLFIHTQKRQNTYNSNILYIQQAFANSQPEFIKKVQNYINIYSTIHEVKYVDIKDLYYHFYKEYIFKDISEVDDFKKKFSIFAREHLEKYIKQIDVEPF